MGLASASRVLVPEPEDSPVHRGAVRGAEPGHLDLPGALLVNRRGDLYDRDPVPTVPRSGARRRPEDAGGVARRPDQHQRGAVAAARQGIEERQRLPGPPQLRCGRLVQLPRIGPGGPV